jgi:hypothetical protein
MPTNFWVGAAGSLLFGSVGIFLFLLGFKIFDWMLPKVDFQDSLKENPLAVSVVIAAFFIAIAQIISAVIH